MQVSTLCKSMKGASALNTGQPFQARGTSAMLWAQAMLLDIQLIS